MSWSRGDDGQNLSMADFKEEVKPEERREPGGVVLGDREDGGMDGGWRREWDWEVVVKEGMFEEEMGD